MSEELLGGNQTTTEPQVTTEPTQTNPVTTQENYFEVKYNKEPVKVSYDEAPTYIQKGLNYDKIQQQAETYQQQLDRTARLAGYQSHEEMITALDELERSQQQQEYEQAGINPDVLNKFLEQHPAIQYANQLQQQQQEQQRLSNEWGELAQEFPNITPEQIPAEVFQLQQARPGLSLLDAYLRVNYKSMGQQAEQQAIQKLQQNQLSSPGSLAQGTEHITSYSQLSVQDKKALRERVLRGENVQF